MNRRCFNALAEGDKVKEGGQSKSFTVMANYGKRVIVVRVCEVSNLTEWTKKTKTVQKSDIKIGSKISHKSWPPDTYAVVTEITPKYATAVMTKSITPKNMESWNLVVKVTQRRLL